MAELIIIDGINIGTGKPCFAVVENDDWKFPERGMFPTREKAQAFIEQQRLAEFHEYRAHGGKLDFTAWEEKQERDSDTV